LFKKKTCISHAYLIVRYTIIVEIYMESKILKCIHIKLRTIIQMALDPTLIVKFQ